RIAVVPVAAGKDGARGGTDLWVGRRRVRKLPPDPIERRRRRSEERDHGSMNIRSGPALILRGPLAAMGVGGEKHAIDVQLEQLLLVPPDSRGEGGRDDGLPQFLGWIDGLRSPSYEELVVDIVWLQG